MGDEVDLAAEAAEKLRVSSESHSESPSGVTKGVRAPSKPGSVPRGFAGANERTRQLASTKLPPGLQAKLEAVR